MLSLILLFVSLLCVGVVTANTTFEISSDVQTGKRANKLANQPDFGLSVFRTGHLCFGLTKHPQTKTERGAMRQALQRFLDAIYTKEIKLPKYGLIFHQKDNGNNRILVVCNSFEEFQKLYNREVRYHKVNLSESGGVNKAETTDKLLSIDVSRLDDEDDELETDTETTNTETTDTDNNTEE